ncbi:MAG: sigma-70 family RNA polymerase sigma factor [Myxococcota bacterium]
MSTDAELLAAWRHGDRAAGNLLVERYFVSVYRFFRNKVDGELDDLVQATFLRCSQAKEAIVERGNFRAYLFAVARNVLTDHYRSRHRGHEALDLSRQSVAELGATPTAVLAQRQEQRLLLEALRSIPLDEQVLLELFYWERMRGRELGAVLGVPEGTVRTRLRSARQSLEAALHRLARSPAQLQSTLDGLERWSEQIRDYMAADLS